MEWEIRTFDPATASRELWARMHAYSNHRHRENDYPGDPPPDPVREDFFRGMPWTVLYVESEEEFAGVAYVRAMPGGNSVHLGGGVRVPWRRRGIGTLWLHAARQRMEETGRERLEARCAAADGQSFFEHAGFTRTTSDGGSRLDVAALDRERMDRWVADLEFRAPGVQIENHTEDLSGEALADYLAIRGRFPDIGEVPGAAGEWRALIGRLRGADGVSHTMFARESDGELVGMTEVIWRPDRAEHITQEFTGVVPEARGRGIGKALKASMLCFAIERHPGVTEIGTSNDTANDPMLSINERMGFVRTIEIPQFEIGLEDLDAWLVTRER